MFANREEAGEILAKKLTKYGKGSKAIIFALPRGGVVVAEKISLALKLPLDVLVVKKLGAPHNPELAIGALAPEGIKYIDYDLAVRVGADEKYIAEEVRKKGKEIEKKMELYGVFKYKQLVLSYKSIIILDDGIATGATAMAAIKYIKQKVKREKKKENTLQPSVFSSQPRIILAVPVIAGDSYKLLKDRVNELITLKISDNFGAVGQFYRTFTQVSDTSVLRILNKYR